MHWNDENDADPIDRVNILIRGAYNVGKTSLCQAFMEALDEMESVKKNRRTHLNDSTPVFDNTSYGVYTRRLNLKDMIPFLTNSQEVSTTNTTITNVVNEPTSIFSNNTKRYVLVSLIDTAGFDTNIGRLPNSMIRDVDGVMLLFSCDLEEDSLRCCHVAYNILARSPQLSSRLNLMEEGEGGGDDFLIGEYQQPLITKTPRYPVFMLVGTKGDLVTPCSLNVNGIKDYWACVKREENPRVAHQYISLLDLENKISKQGGFKMTQTHFTSSLTVLNGSKKGGGVLKAFMSLVYKVLETRSKASRVTSEMRRMVGDLDHSSAYSEKEPIKKNSDLNSELRRVNRKSTGYTSLYINHSMKKETSTLVDFGGKPITLDVGDATEGNNKDQCC